MFLLNSAIHAAPAITYDTDAQAYFTALGAGDQPNAAQKARINKLVLDLKANGWWYSLSELMIAGHSISAFYRNLMNPSAVGGSYNGTPSFVQDRGVYLDSGEAISGSWQLGGGTVATGYNFFGSGIWCLSNFANQASGFPGLTARFTTPNQGLVTGVDVYGAQTYKGVGANFMINSDEGLSYSEGYTGTADVPYTTAGWWAVGSGDDGGVYGWRNEETVVQDNLYAYEIEYAQYEMIISAYGNTSPIGVFAVANWINDAGLDSLYFALEEYKASLP